MKKPDAAPHCFAAASVFTHDSEICRGCSAFDECAVASLATLEAIRNVVNVQDLLKRHSKAKTVSRAAIKANDERLAAERLPGNIDAPQIKMAERKTQVVKVEFETSADQERIIATLPVKPQKIAVALCKTGMLHRIKKGLAEGRNALADAGPPWLRIALTALIAGGFSRSELKAVMAQELEWNETSAAPHVSMAVALLTAFGITQEIEGRIVLVPASGSQYDV